MPKFNMSQDEARALVDYFAAVERFENPGIGLKYPYETIPQQEALSDAFWFQKNAEYIAKLKAAKTKDAGGKDISLYDSRLQELRPVLEQIRKDLEAKQTEAKAKMDAAKPKLDAAKKAEDAEKDQTKKTNLEAVRKNEEGIFQAWEAEYNTLVEQLKKSSVDEQIKTWETEEAYVTDAFRILANKQLCMQCHQIGKTPNTNQIQGPPLYLSYQRLRPGWLERWIATPQRFLTYASSMPNNFPVDKPGQYQELFVGTPLEQIIGVRDVLMLTRGSLPCRSTTTGRCHCPARPRPPANQETTRNDTRLCRYVCKRLVLWDGSPEPSFEVDGSGEPSHKSIDVWEDAWFSHRLLRHFFDWRQLRPCPRKSMGQRQR